MAADDRFKAEFSFTWKIKNFSFCLPWKMVRSPVFIIESMDKTRWCLHIWPKDYTNGIHMEYYLAREEADNGPEFIRVAFELSFLDSQGIQLVKKSRVATFTRDAFKGFSEFVEQAMVFTHKRREYLPENTLTACCRMRCIGEMSQKQLVICSATSLIGVERSSFDWNIEKFSKIPPGRKRSIERNNPFVKVELSLTAKPEEALEFEISHSHMGEPNMTDCEISVMNAFKRVVYSKKDSRYLEGKVWKFPIFLKKSQLIVERNVCLQKDILALKCKISISLGVISSVINGYRSRSSSLKDETSPGNFQSSSCKDEVCSSTAKDGKISLNQKHILSLKKDVRKLFNGERKNSKEIPELLSKDSSSSTKEVFYLTQSNERSSSEYDTVGKCDDMNPSFENEVILDEKESFPLTIHDKIIKYEQRKDTEETREMNIKEINHVTSTLNENAKKTLEEFSSEDDFSLMNDIYFLTQNGECFSTEDEIFGELNRSDNESFGMEEIVSTNCLKSELQHFYRSGTFSDISLTVGKDTFPAHKLILSLRSLKFKEILMTDLSKTSIKIADLDSEILRDLLDFIYTNNVDSMTWQKAQKLCLVAESYQVTSLKHACYMFMKKTINESNVCHVLLLADEQQDEVLKQLALEFIVKHGKAIMNTKAWNELSKSHIKLAFEAMQQMYLNKTEKETPIFEDS